MPKIRKRITFFYALTASLATLVTVILRTVALFTEYEAEAGFYASPTLAIATAAVLAAVGVGLAAFAYQEREHFVFSSDYRDLPSLVSGVYFAVSLLFFGVMLLLGARSAAPAALVTAILAALFAGAGTAPFVLHAFDGRTASATAAMLTLPTAAFGVLYALYLGFESEIMLTSPVKLLSTATWVFATLFFLGEARIALSRARWALHLSVTALTVTLSGTLALPNLVLHAVEGSSLLFNTAHAFAALGLFLYAAARLAAILSTPCCGEEAEATDRKEAQHEEAPGR